MLPMLKNAVWSRSGDALYVVDEPERQVVLSDQDGKVERLLALLRAGTRDHAQLAAALAVPEPEVRAAVRDLDELGLVVDASAPGGLRAEQRERHFSNLAFFTTFASLGRSATALQRAMLDARVVFLGTGGLGSTVIQSLTGAGTGRMTLLDSDVVDLRNFARQYLYRREDIGERKVARAAAWIQAFAPEAEVQAVDRRIAGPGDIRDLLPGASLVVSGADHPGEIDQWVNQACVEAGVPYVRGGMFARRIVYWSVDPGRSACLECRRRALGSLVAEPGVPGDRLRQELDRVNRGTGPVASLLGGLVAMEALRYLTGFAPPIAAGCERFADLRSGTEEVRAWPRWRDCPVCAAAPRRRQGLAEPAEHRG